MAVTLSEKAITKVKAQLEKEGRAGGVLRLFISAGGCSGMNYNFEFTDAAEQDDTVFETAGVKLAVAQKALFFVNGATVDWHQTMMESGFRVTNPNATAACNCGTSFSAEAQTSGADLF
jgi:iron-sulfur cluster assembly accessory protein